MEKFNAFVLLVSCILFVGCNDDKKDNLVPETHINAKFIYEAFLSDAENYNLDVGYIIGPTNDKIIMEIQESPFTYERNNLKVSDVLYISASAKPNDILFKPPVTVTARIYIDGKLLAEDMTNIEDENDTVAYASVICGVDEEGNVLYINVP